MPLNLDFSFRTHGSSDGARESDDSPLRIAVLGAFSGQAEPDGKGLGGTPVPRRSQRIDVDTFEQVMADMAPAITLPLGGSGDATVTLEPRDLEDFHPDALHGKLEVFAALRDLRSRLRNPNTFAAAASQLVAPQAPPDEGPVPRGAPANDGTDAGAGGLDDLLNRPAAARAPHGAHLGRHGATDRLVRAAVEGHVIPTPDPRLETCLDQVDVATAGILRHILHHPKFQALEAAWRGVDFIMRRFDAEAIEIVLVDISATELHTAASAANAPPDWLETLLGAGASDIPGQAPWDLIIGLYDFGPEATDLALLESLGQAARRVGCSFLAAAGPGLVGAADMQTLTTPHGWSSVSPAIQSAWERLRGLPEGRHLGLALPRFLLRLPYGRKGEPVEALDFEEIGSPVRHEGFLWGNPAILAACALIADKLGIEDNGRVGYGSRQVDDLSYFTYEEDGRSVALPCGEVWLPDRSAEQLLAQGLMPVQSVRGMDAVLLILTSLSADPLP